MATTRQTNPKKTIVAINGSAGAQVSIKASKFTRYVEIQECAPDGAAASFTGGNYAPVGTNYTLPDDGFTNFFPLTPGAVLSIGDNNWERDRLIGVPAITDPGGNTIAATVYCKMISATAGTTQVLVSEWS